MNRTFFATMRAPIRSLALLLVSSLALGVSAAASAAEIAFRDGRVLKDVTVLERGSGSVLVQCGRDVLIIPAGQLTAECAASLGIRSETSETVEQDAARIAADEARRKEAEEKEAANRKARERRATRRAITSEAA